MSRWVISLFVIQIVLISALLVKTNALENQVAALHADSGAVVHSATTESPPLSATEGDGWLDEGQLRQIVADEMRRAVAGFPATITSEPDGSEEPRISAEEYQARLESTMSELEYHIEQGEISAGEMARLQVDIARLDEESRSHVLSLLVKAVSTGELDGEL